MSNREQAGRHLGALGQTLRAFERAAGFPICFRPIVPEWQREPLGPVPKRYLQHSNRYCQQAKRRVPGACTKDCLLTAHSWQRTCPQPPARTCHAGASEIRLPVEAEGELIAVIHLGPYRLLQQQDPQLPLVTAQREQWLVTLAQSLADRLLALYRRSRRLQSGGGESLLRSIERFIDERLASSLDRDQVAAHLNKSPNWVSHYIRQQTGRTFSQIKDDRRMKRARRLLIASDLKIEAVASALGMEPSRFYRFFKAQTGRTPARYRRQFGLPGEIVQVAKGQKAVNRRGRGEKGLNRKGRKGR